MLLTRRELLVELKEERSGALLNMTKDLAKFVVVFSDQLILPYKLWPQLQGVLKHKEDILAAWVDGLRSPLSKCTLACGCRSGTSCSRRRFPDSWINCKSLFRTKAPPCKVSEVCDLLLNVLRLTVRVSLVEVILLGQSRYALLQNKIKQLDDDIPDISTWKASSNSWTKFPLSPPEAILDLKPWTIFTARRMFQGLGKYLWQRSPSPKLRM